MSIRFKLILWDVSRYNPLYGLLIQLLTQHVTQETVWSTGHIGNVEVVVVSGSIGTVHHCPATWYEKQGYSKAAFGHHGHPQQQLLIYVQTYLLLKVDLCAVDSHWRGEEFPSLPLLGCVLTLSVVTYQFWFHAKPSKFWKWYFFC